MHGRNLCFDALEVTEKAPWGYAMVLACHYRRRCYTRANQYSFNHMTAEIAAVATCFGVFVTFRQLLAMEAQITEMRKTANLARESIEQSRKAIEASVVAAQTDQRAWVGVESVILTPMEAGAPLSITVHFKNVGKTPALKVRPSIDLLTRDKALSPGDLVKEHNHRSADKDSDAAMFPGANKYLPANIAEPLTPIVIEQFQKGLFFIYVIGTIKYEDVFGNKRQTRISQTYSGAVGAFHTNDAHNDAD